MELRRLEFLLELSRQGSMAKVAAELGHTTSTVSQQLAQLGREAGTPLLEPAGRRVRLTPAGRRLADHAVTILAAVEAARADLDPAAEPRGTVRVAGFATAVRRALVPVLATLAAEHPDVNVQVREHEPDEALTLLRADQVDLALVYDYDLAPAAFDPALRHAPLWTVPWALAVPAGARPPTAEDAPGVFRRFAGHPWIVNSRGTADEQAARAIASIAGIELSVAHRADSLELVEDLIVAGLGVGLLPADVRPRDGVRLIALDRPAVTLRAHAVTRRGRDAWPPLRLVTALLGAPADDARATSVTPDA